MKDGKYRILIVDDEKDVLDALQMTLTRAKEFQCEVEMAPDGSAALALLEKGEFDIVISDYKMPGMNGIDLLVAVKEKFPGTARILITGYSDVNVARDAMMKAQVLDYVEKPWDNTHLRATVMDAVKSASK